MVINQGDVFWLTLPESEGAGPAFRHSHVVIQNNLFNHSRINTTVVCVITSNLRRGAAPGNVTLRKGEASLPKKCVVNVSQLLTVDKSILTERIGSLGQNRIDEILAGLRLLTEPRSV